jgi:hypothetical protein
MTTKQELQLFRALRLILRLLCILVYNQIHQLRNQQYSDVTLDTQMELEQEASNFARHEL